VPVIESFHQNPSLIYWNKTGITGFKIYAGVFVVQGPTDLPVRFNLFCGLISLKLWWSPDGFF